LASAILLSAIFLASLASGQEYQTKGSGESSKKMNKTTTTTNTTNQDPKATTTPNPSETAPASVKPPEGEKQDGKTVPAVQTSKDKPGTGTNTSQQIPASTGTLGQKGSTSGMTSANAIKEPINIYNGQGKLIATVDAEGWIRDPEQRLLAQYTAEGEYYTKNRVKAGNVKDGVIFDKDGNKFAKITRDGEIQGKDGKTMGRISPDGAVTDNAGKKLGSGPGADRNVLAVLFFYQKNMASKGYSTSNKK
jgi:hypothetical protein